MKTTISNLLEKKSDMNDFGGPNEKIFESEYVGDFIRNTFTARDVGIREKISCVNVNEFFYHMSF